MLDLVRHLKSTIENLKFLLTQSNFLRLVPKWFLLKHLHEYGRFPYRENKINEWFVQHFFNEDAQESKAVNIINLDQQGRITKSYIQDQAPNFPNSLADDQFELFVHGTDYISAVDIIENGIKLSAGKEAQDFSDGDGFYVGNDFDEAVLWARKKYPNKQAVLIYKVDKIELRGDNNNNGLDLRYNKREWLRVVLEFRCTGSGAKTQKPNKRYRKELKGQYEFIEGPMASVSRKSPRPTEMCDTYQLCVRKKDCVGLFNHSLHSVVFFER